MLKYRYALLLRHRYCAKRSVYDTDNDRNFSVNLVKVIKTVDEQDMLCIDREYSSKHCNVVDIIFEKNRALSIFIATLLLWLSRDQRRSAILIQFKRFVKHFLLALLENNFDLHCENTSKFLNILPNYRLHVS